MASPLVRAAERCLAAVHGGKAEALHADPDVAGFLDFLLAEGVGDEALEWACTELREALLKKPATELAAALAVQCFRNDYAFQQSKGELALVDALEARLGMSPALADLAAYAMYRPLHRLTDAAAIASGVKAEAGSRGETMLRVMLLEPLAEAAIRPDIRTLTPIADATSKAVQDQYEDHPFPRWHKFPRVRPMEDATKGRLLVAGCGTGRHALTAGRQAPEARVLAVDLSAASLAYGIRKARELGVENVEFAHADLLALPAAGLKFDAITSVGVVHHMRNPVDGLRALREMMAHDTGLKVAVYTESGRRGVVAALALREEYRLPSTAAGIREFRRIVQALEEDHPARELTTYEDFYSVSGCRDLAFHVMEHRYTLPRFEQQAAEAGLRIQAILVADEVRQKFVARHPDPATASDMQAWDVFETENPGIFGSMYRFMLAKL